MKAKENMARVEKLYKAVMGVSEEFDYNRLLTISASELQKLSEEEAITADAVFREITRHTNKVQELLGKK